MTKDIAADAAAIRKIGVKKLANKLGYSYQRVFNWLNRGIPFHVKAAHPEWFKQQKTPTA